MEVVAIITLVKKVFILSVSKPHILFVGAFPPPERQVFGGMVTSCKALLASTFPDRVKLDLLDSTQIANPPPVLYIRLVHAVARFIRFVHYFKANRPDAVLLFVSAGASILEKGAMAWYARLHRVPAIMFPRSGAVVNAGQASAITRKWVKLSFRGARKIVCQSEVWRRFALDTLGFSAADVVVIRNWTATPELLRIGAQRRVRSNSPTRLIFVGWLEREKGIMELIDACQQLHGRHEFLLDIIGDGHASAEARERVARHDLSEVVRFRGWLQEADVHEALGEADVFVLPSWAEGLPNAMVEAMAARLAIVVTRVGAIPDIIVDHHSGLLIPPGDVRALSNALVEMLGNSVERERMAIEAHRVAICEFGVEEAVTRIVEVIENVVAECNQRN